MTKTIDLTHVINEKISIFPETLPPSIKQANTIEKDGFAELKLNISTHTGTHMDSPSHMITNAVSLDKFPIDKFIGKAISIPSRESSEISVEYLKKFESEISKVDFIIFNTGQYKKWGEPEYLSPYPTLSADSAEWLTNFNLSGLAFDTISVDKIDSTDQINHHILMKKNILIIENLANLNMLPEGIFTFFCIPLKIENTDGSPIRAFAVID